MSDLRRRLHAAAAAPASELDTEGLTALAFRRRRRRAVAMTAAAAVVVLAAGGGVLAARDAARNDTLRTRGNDSETTLTPSTPEPSTSTSSNPTTTVAPVPPGSTTTLAPGDGGPVHATPTTGLGNFDDVTITATGLPAGSYDIAQCPSANARAGDFLKCQGLTIVDVSDGQLSASVTVSWWMDHSNVDCGTAVGTCLVGMMSTDPKSTFVPVAFDLGFDPARRPRFEVSPNIGLVDGQQVEVRGFNIGGGDVTVSECLGDQWASCTYTTAAVGANGNFTATFPVARILHWSYHGYIEETGECDVDATCVIEVWVTPPGQPDGERMRILPIAPVTLAFVPAPPTSTTTTTTTP